MGTLDVIPFLTSSINRKDEDIMIEELSQDRYYKIDNLIRNNKFPEVTSVIKKNIPGWFFVDNIDEPKSA